MLIPTVYQVVPKSAVSAMLLESMLSALAGCTAVPKLNAVAKFTGPFSLGTDQITFLTILPIGLQLASQI